MKILVVGAGGQLGVDVVRAGQAQNHEVVALAHHDLDIGDKTAVDRLFRQETPAAVINCAAYTNVDGAEDEAELAFEINAQGAANIAASAERVGCKVIYVSTDYVFDGNKQTPYVESDSVDPQSVYGKSKLAGEERTSELNSKCFVVRTSWLFGITGHNFVNTMLDLAAESGEVLVVNDQIGCPTYTGHLAEALVGLVDSSSIGIHHIAGWGECSWYEFAQEIFSQAGVECRVMAGTTEMLARKASRPAYSSLISEREHPVRLPRWQEGVTDFLNARRALSEGALK